jgi:hypothetical protein
MRNPFRFGKKMPRSKINTDSAGHSVLTKTADFKMYAIRSTENEDELLGAILLTEAQQLELNKAINEKGIKFTRK